MLNAGTLDKVLVIQSQASTLNAVNEKVGTWSTFATIRANVRNQPGTEQFESEQQTPRRRALVKAWNRTDITEEMRIVYQSKNWDIISIMELGRDDGMEIVMEWNGKN